MPKKLLYFLILIIAVNCYPLFAQEIEYAKEKKDTEQSYEDIQKDVEELPQQAVQIVDSLSAHPGDLITNATDSLGNLSGEFETKVQSKIDSLNALLNEIENKANLPADKIQELEANITGKLDSLQQALSDKLHLDKVNEYSGGLPGEAIENQLPTDALPSLEKLSIPGMPGVNTQNISSGSLSLDKGNLLSHVDQQLGKSIDLKDNDWINIDMPDYQKYKNEVKQYSEVLEDPSKLDQVIDTHASQLSEMQSLNNDTKELAAMKSLPESMLADLKRYQDEQALKTQAREVGVEQATDYFADHQDKLAEAQSLMTELKKKYSYIPDSRDLSTAIKATSLKEEPLKRRMKFGLGFQLHQTNPISLDLAPNILYRFNTLISAGISFTYRTSLGIENKQAISPYTSTNVYGGSAIVQHMVWKGFFAHAEFEYMSTPIKDPNTNNDLESRRWNEGALLGIGKKVALSKGINGQVIFTYDFLHDDQSPNPKAWNIKFGFQLGNFKLKDINF